MEMADRKITSPLSGWVGGKFLLAPKLIPLIPEHNTWVEVFAGAAWLTFRKKASACEVLNDINSDVINLYRYLRDRPEGLIRYARFALHSRAEFEYWQNYAGCDPEKSAWRLLYILKCCFAGRDCGNLQAADFGYDIKNKHTPRRISRLPHILSCAHARLTGVTLECQDWRGILRRYDSPGTFFYLDPPYYGHEKDYGKKRFARVDFMDLASALGGIKGRFMLSMNDRPETRRIFRSFRMHTLMARYSSGSEHKAKKPELILTNYALQAQLPGLQTL